ncbi:MAG: hypothetical protein NTU53_09560 [Planctomycetota bacterium]|nr:hypothetical protein [Planctomycetota bacterium]
MAEQSASLAEKGAFSDNRANSPALRLTATSWFDYLCHRVVEVMLSRGMRKAAIDLLRWCWGRDDHG